MPQDPMVIFGNLLRGCISDRYLKADRKSTAEGLLFMVMGMASSILTTYALSAVGLLV
jgi:sugar phosphate permease